MKTNEFVSTLKDLEVAERVEQVKAVLRGVGNATTGEVVDLLFPHLADEDKFRMAILIQVIMKNMNDMHRGL